LRCGREGKALQFHFDASQVQAVDFTLIGGLRASACVP
jgi:hypothetical protein